MEFAIYYKRGWGWDDVRPQVETVIQGYFTDLAKSWADAEEALIVRISQIESRLLDVEGILDVANTKINGHDTSYQIPLDTIPKLGTMTAKIATIAGV